MFASSRVIGTGAGLLEIRMRTSILAMVVVAGSAIAFQATAQQAAPSDLTKEQIQQRDADKGLKTSEPNEQMQRDADKGVKTRNSGESGFVADQDKPGAAAHPPGRPEGGQTTGSGSQTGAPK
jgi:hypothetical protein